jgi:membrane-bound ClpP family serine protease
MYLLLAFFAADNVLSWLTSPLIFYPLLLVVSIVALAFSMGLDGLMLPFVKTTVNTILR